MRFFILFLLLFSSLYADLLKDLQDNIVYAEKGNNLIGHIYIGEEIDQSTWIFVNNALEYYKKKEPIFIILELNTNGGELYAAQKISDALKELDQGSNISVVAYINNRALSSGAILPYSCRFIATVESGKMGANQEEIDDVTSNIHSSIRIDFGNRANFFRRNPLIAQAMVEPIITLVWRNNNIFKIYKDEEIEKTDKIIVKKDHELVLNAQEMMEYKVADILLKPATLPPITEEEKEEGQWPFSKELLSTAPFFDKIPNGIVDSYQADATTMFFSILSSPIISSLLFLIFIVAFYLELCKTGFGIAGFIGIGALLLIILSSYSGQLYSLFELILLVTGIGFILVEIFLTPTFNLSGILGIILAILGVILLLLPGIQEFSYDSDSHALNAAGKFLLERSSYLGVTLLVAFLIILILNRLLPNKIRFSSPLIHKENVPNEMMSFNPPVVGDEGIVFEPLRPSGKVILKNKIYDAVSVNGFIDKGVTVKVVAFEGNKIDVEKVNK